MFDFLTSIDVPICLAFFANIDFTFYVKFFIALLVISVVVSLISYNHPRLWKWFDLIWISSAVISASTIAISFDLKKNIEKTENLSNQVRVESSFIDSSLKRHKIYIGCKTTKECSAFEDIIAEIRKNINALKKISTENLYASYFSNSIGDSKSCLFATHLVSSSKSIFSEVEGPSCYIVPNTTNFFKEMEYAINQYNTLIEDVNRLKQKGQFLTTGEIHSKQELISILDIIAMLVFMISFPLRIAKSVGELRMQYKKSK